MLYKPLRRNIAVAYVVTFTSSFALFHPILALYLAEQLHSVFAVTLIYALITFGSAALEIPTGVLADRWGRKVSAGASLFFNEPPRETLAHKKGSHVIAAVRMICGKKALLLLVISSLVFDLTMEPIYQLSQIFYAQNGIPVAMLGVITFTVMALRSCVAFCGHNLTVKIGQHATLLLVIICSLVLTWTATLLHGWIAAMPLMLVYVLFGIIYPLMSDLLNGHLQSHSRATALSMINMMSSLGLSITVPLMGYLADDVGIHTAYRIFVTFLIAILVLQLRRKNELYVLSPGFVSRGLRPTGQPCISSRRGAGLNPRRAKKGCIHRELKLAANKPSERLQ